MKKIIIVLLLVVGVFLLKDYIDINALVLYFNEIKTNSFAPLIFIASYALLSSFGVPATPLTLIAGPLFGLWFGILYTVIASNMACHISYFLAKFIGRDAILKRIKNGSFIDTATKKASENAFVFMMYVRLIPLFPFVAVNYLSGILNINFKSYSIATLLGMFPATVIYVYLGYTATDIRNNPLGLVVSILILVIFTLIITVISKKKRGETIEN